MRTKKYKAILEFHNTNKKMKTIQSSISKQIKNFNFIVVNYQTQHKIQMFSSGKMYNRMKKVRIEMLV
jgi:hypothetical protein